MIAGMSEPAVSLGEAQAFVRVETGEEEAVLAGLVRSASALCEAFLGQVVVARSFTEDVPASSEWKRLSATPVRSIEQVDAVDGSGSATALPSSSFAIDVDSSGDGWVRFTGAESPRRLRIAGVAGMAETSNEVPEPIRQGVLRLVAHLYASRDGAGGDPPAAVTALWRPYRRMRLA